MPDASDDDVIKLLEIVLGLCRERIPARFHRTFEARPFDTCTYCQSTLLVEGANSYLITKLYAGGELREELAVCRACSQDLKKGYSDESRQTLSRIYNEQYRQRRLQILFGASAVADRVALMTAACSICGASRTVLSDYVEYAMCLGEELVFYTHPSLMCMACTRKIYEGLSAQTREYKHRFFEKHFGFPPPGMGLSEPAQESIELWTLG